jgi:hypothetical protein
MSPSPILVTGMCRSGTTWVGKMLAAGGGVTYVHEPLNHLHGILPTPGEYTHVSAENEAEFLPVLENALRQRLRSLTGASLRTPKDVARVIFRAGQFFRGRVQHRRVLLKENFAVFSAEWFADRLGCRVVVVVRHPAAAISSFVRLNWRAPLAHLSAQPALVRDWLEPFSDDLQAANDDPRLANDIIWSNALLWRIIYSTVGVYAKRRPDFLIVRHEDLSRAPEAGYRNLYEGLDLPYGQRPAAAIRAATRADNPNELSVHNAYSVKLDSRANLANWHNRLSAADIEQIRTLTEPVASLWYKDSDWA